jgi:hypothetical protein
MSSTHRHLLLDFFWQVISGPPCIQRVTEISTFILTGNRTRHDEQFFYVPLFRNRQFFLTFSPP